MTEVQADEKPVEQSGPVEEQKKSTKEPSGVENIEEESEEENLNGDDDESEEELGLLEKPVEILDRKRDRKSTERLSLGNTEKKKTEDELDYTKGQGTKLGDIPFVKQQMDKIVADDLRTLHRILFLKAGKVSLIKKNIRSFCGYPFDKNSIYYTRASNSIDKNVVANIKFILGIFGLEKKGDRTELRDKLLDYLMKPTLLDKYPQLKKNKRKSKSKTSQKKSSNKSKKKKEDKEKAKKSDETVSDDDDEDDSGEDEDSNDEDKVKEVKEKKSKTPKKKNDSNDKKKKSPPKKAAAIKIPMPKKKDGTPKKKDPSPKKRKVQDSDDDDEPLLKKTKSEPSDAELRKVVSEILKDADLEQVTMKTVVKQVYEKYPEFDLTPRKDFIKNTVKEIIS